MLLPNQTFGPNKLWRLFPKASLIFVGFLVVTFLYRSCSTCNSKFVWISLALSEQTPATQQFDASTQHDPPTDARLPSTSPQQSSRTALSAVLDDSGSKRNREADHVKRVAPLQKVENGSFSQGELGDRGPNLRANFEREDHGWPSKYSPSNESSESKISKPDQTAIGSEIGAEEIEIDLRNPQMANLELSSASRESESAQQRPPVDRHEISSPSSEKPNWSLKMEQDLLKAKHAIAMAAAVPFTAGEDLQPEIYHNVSKFKKSYELMEKMFRIFVYAEGRRPLVHSGPTVGIYASEGRFIHLLQQNRQFVTKGPNKAHMFFLPYSVANMVIKLYVPNSHSMLPLTDFITSYVNLIASRHPFWNRSQGADHFFVSCHDWGPATARGHAQLRRNSVKVACNADLTEEFVLHRDIALPEIYLHKTKPPTNKQLGGPSPGRKRPFLAFFAGHMHGRVRPILLQHWKDKDPSIKIYEMLPASVAKKTSYVKMSKFCICAMGFEVNSPRIVEAIYYDCVPVIIADNFVLPFSEVLDWAAFSLVVKEEEVPLLKQILMNIPADRYLAMQSRLKHMRQHFMWHHHQSSKYDAFHMILHSLWLSRLASLPP